MGNADTEIGEKKRLIRKCRRKAIYWKLLDWFSGARESAVSTTMRDDIVISESMRCFSRFLPFFFSPSFSSPSLFTFFFDFQGERRVRELVVTATYVAAGTPGCFVRRVSVGS